LKWEKMGLACAPDGSMPWVTSHAMLYNGNNYGESGFGVAVLEGS
jgi:hypothetical protein